MAVFIFNYLFLFVFVLLLLLLQVTRPLLQTSRKGYLAAVSSSSYSFVSLLQHFLPLMNKGGAALALSYIASERVIPGTL